MPNMSLVSRVPTLIFYPILAAGGHTINTAEYLSDVQLLPLLLHNLFQLLVGVSVFHLLINFLFNMFHTTSMGFKLGDCGGHFMTSTP